MNKLLLILFLIPFYSNSQRVLFCEEVDHIGNPKNSSNEFTVSEKGGFLKVLIRLNHKASTNSVIIDVFHKSGNSKNLENTIRMKINPFMTWFYKEITFFKEGEYEIYVYDEKDKMMAAGKVKIRFK